jgi:hypothetical protein
MAKTKKNRILAAISLAITSLCIGLAYLFTNTPIFDCYFKRNPYFPTPEFNGACELNFITRWQNPSLIERQKSRIKGNFSSTLKRCNKLLKKLQLDPNNKEIEKDFCKHQSEMISASKNPNTYFPLGYLRFDAEGITIDAYMNPFEIAFFPKEKLWKIKSKGFFTSLDFDDHIQEIPVPTQQEK